MSSGDFEVNLPPPKRILVIEDTMSEAFLLKKYVENLASKAIVDHVITLVGAHKKCSEKKYDLIFLDLNLPDGYGPNSITDLKKFSGDAPVIVATGFLADLTMEESLCKGAKHIFSKNQLFGGDADEIILKYISSI